MRNVVHTIGSHFVLTFLLDLLDLHQQTQRDPRLNEILYPFANKQTIKYIQENYETQDEFKNTG